MANLELPLHTERLTLRAHRLDDLDALLSYYSNPDVARYIPWEPWTRADAEKHLPNRVTRTTIEKLGLVVEHEGRAIGDVVVWAADETLERGEMGWAFHPDVAGHGYATEAVRALIATAFDVFGMRRVYAQLDSRNAASAKLCERVGMTREAYLRQDHWTKGEWTDNIVYGLLADEWRR